MARLDIDIGADFTIVVIQCRGAKLAPLKKDDGCNSNSSNKPVGWALPTSLNSGKRTLSSS